MTETSVDQRCEPMEFHPAAELFPMLAEQELLELAADIRVRGLLLAIVTYEGKILDGRNRKRACRPACRRP